MGELRQKLSLAALALVSAGGPDVVRAEQSPWELDTSFLSYVEADDRVSVSKTLANLTRLQENGSVSVNLVHDTMSGASPTGAIRSSESAVTFTSASGGGEVNTDSGGDYSKGYFEDTRVQAGLAVQRDYRSDLAFNFGGTVSQESDYDSYGVDIGVTKESRNRLTTYTAGLAYTTDSIYRSDTGGTPEPLSNIRLDRPFTEGTRTTVNTLLGVTRVLNKRTLAQFNVSVGLSNGYHSDPYKIISAADEENRIVANFHDSRPESRIRTTAYAQLVHELTGSKNTMRVSYRLYRDDWGVASHTGVFRYRHQLTDKQYLEPHVRVYWQNEADFYQRKLNVDEGLNPILPESGFVSSDYRLDSMSSVTFGMKYGVSLTNNTQLRFRAEYLNQSFSSAEYDSNSAVIIQTSFRYGF